MNRHVASDRFVDSATPDSIANISDSNNTYLADRWQGVFDQLSGQHNHALFLYMSVSKRGYEIKLASEQVQAFYDTSRELETTGGDFVDLVRGYRRLLLVKDSQQDIRLTKSREVTLGFRMLMGQPIYDQHQAIKGILLVMDKDVVEVDPSFASAFHWLATSLEESVRYLSVEREIHGIRNVDPLTRLVSRDKMMSIVGLEFERSQRSDIPFSMVVIDIDDFKHINETFGHDVGDKVLREFSEEIVARIRMVDTACRWDGDAFVVLCPQTDLLGANVLVNDLFNSLSHHIFPNVGRCFFSMGIADYGSNDVSVNDMLLRMDKALFRVKAFGGNSHRTRYH